MTVLRTLPPLAALGAALLLSACVVSESTGGSAAAEADAAAAEGAPGTGSTQAGGGDRLAAAVAGDWRDPDFVARDKFRHPAETLAFFGIAPDDTVIEITPGGGWYAEILAPYLRDDGSYVAAVWDDAIPDQPAYRYRLNEALRNKFAAAPEVYGTPQVRVFDPAKPLFGPSESADAVLTFRNAHNWVADGNAEAYFSAFFDVLRPGGTLGVVDHRAREGTDLETMKSSGYLTEALVVELAEGAGFTLEERSEVNANPADTADHPNGVWTLPPSNNHEEADAERYRAIGESDRMTLRFRKPG